MRRALLAALCLLLSLHRVGACPYRQDSPLHALRFWSDQAIVRIEVLGPGTCVNTGTGFFINAAGDVLSAGHLVTPACESNATIKLYWPKQPGSGELSDGLRAQVVKRDIGHDLVVLRPAEPLDASRQYLTVEALPPDPSPYKNACAVLTSIYADQSDALTSFVEISSIALLGDKLHWALEGEGFNGSRSGSPVILEDGKAVAIFLSRPGDPTDRATVIQNRAYILPLAYLSTNPLDLASLVARTGTLTPFLTRPVDETGQPAKAASAIKSVFGLSITVDGFQLDSNLPWYLEKNGTLIRAQSPEQAAVKAALTHSNILRQVRVDRHLQADSGYVFDPSDLKIEVASLNPVGAPLPTRPCKYAYDTDCYSLSADKTKLDLHFNFFPGIDGRRSWLDAEIRVTQRKESDDMADPGLGGVDFIATAAVINPVTPARSPIDSFKECVNSPVCAVVANSAASYFGFPSGTLEAVAAVVTGGTSGEESRFDISLPAGYQYCRLNLQLTSIAPRAGDRAAALSVKSKPSGVGIYTWVPKGQVGTGKNWIDGSFTVLGVRNDRAEQFRSTGRCGPIDKLLIDCRGDQGGQGKPACHSGRY